ncbi:MAG: anti-sigma factor family protein [Candidatus Acidiferrales bacterium]
MDHTEAIRTRAAEQYLLGELPVSRRDEFEEHFMSCGECAQDLRAGGALLGNIKDALRYETASARQPAPERRESWIAALLRPSIAAPAFAVLIAVIAYEGLVSIPHMQSELSRATAPTSITSFSLLGGSSRGEASVPVVALAGEPFALYVDIPPQPAFPLYTLDVESAAGARQFSLPISAEQAQKTIEVFVPAGRLDAGDYVVSIRGMQPQTATSGTQVAHLRFSLTYKN